MLISKKRLWQGRAETVRHYYKSPKFALLDLFYSFFTLFSNPYRVSRRYLQKKGEKDIYLYGETPFSTYEKIAKEAGLKKEDIWFELGSGRGKGCFWLSHFYKCSVVGVEMIPQFIFLSKLIRFIFRMKKNVFFQKDIREVDLKKATVIYLYGIWLELNISFETKVISISEPLDGFEVIKSFWVRFPWGRTTAYLQKKKPPSKKSSPL